MGKHPSDRPNKYQIKRLQHNHREILRLRAMGLQPHDIARELKCCPQTVSIVTNSELGKAKVNELQEARDESAKDVMERMRKLAPKVVDLLDEFISDEDCPRHIRLKAGTEILDRAGYPAQRQISGSVSHGHFTIEDIEAMKERARQSGALIMTKRENGTYEKASSGTDPGPDGDFGS